MSYWVGGKASGKEKGVLFEYENEDRRRKLKEIQLIKQQLLRYERCHSTKFHSLYKFFKYIKSILQLLDCKIIIGGEG